MRATLALATTLLVSSQALAHDDPSSHFHGPGGLIIWAPLILAALAIAYRATKK